MAEYISSFVTGFDTVIGEAMARWLPGVKVIRVYDGLVHYSYGGNVQNICRLSFFNNSFLVYQTYRGGGLSFERMVAQAAGPADRGRGTFRVRFSRENQFAKVGKQTALAAEKKISGSTHQRVDRVNPQNEYWFLIRREKIGFFGKLLRKRKVTEKTLHKGELRPELALLMCVFAGIGRDEVLCDPFAGYGAIPAQAVQAYPIRKMYVSDWDRKLVDRLGQMEALKRGGVCIRCEDALRLESVKDGEIDLVLTDPPWGYYEEIGDIGAFYGAMLRSFRRVLKAGGRAVVLSARKEEMAAAVERERGIVEKRIDTLVNGKKAGIYLIRFLG